MSMGGVVLDGGCERQNRWRHEENGSGYEILYAAVYVQAASKSPSRCSAIYLEMPCLPCRSSHLFRSSMGWWVDRGQRFGHRHRAGEGRIATGEMQTHFSFPSIGFPRASLKKQTKQRRNLSI